MSEWVFCGHELKVRKGAPASFRQLEMNYGSEIEVEHNGEGDRGDTGAGKPAPDRAAGAEGWQT